MCGGGGRWGIGTIFQINFSPRLVSQCIRIRNCWAHISPLKPEITIAFFYRRERDREIEIKKTSAGVLNCLPRSESRDVHPGAILCLTASTRATVSSNCNYSVLVFGRFLCISRISCLQRRLNRDRKSQLTQDRRILSSSYRQHYYCNQMLISYVVCRPIYHSDTLSALNARSCGLLYATAWDPMAY